MQYAYHKIHGCLVINKIHSILYLRPKILSENTLVLMSVIIRDRIYMHLHVFFY